MTKPLKPPTAKKAARPAAKKVIDAKIGQHLPKKGRSGEKPVAPQPKAPFKPKPPKTPTKRKTTPPRARPGSTKKSGRPSLWQDEYCMQAYKLTLLGWDDKQLADFFQVPVSTLAHWKHTHPEFLDSITQGKGPADANVAHSLYQRALGYSHPDVDIRTLSHGLNASAELVVTDIVKHYPPDTAAASLWLRNRANKLWKERNQTELVGAGEGPIQTQNQNVQLTPDEAYRMMLNKPKE